MIEMVRRWNRRRALLCVASLILASQGFGQDTAYPPQDAQIPGPASAADQSAWLADLQHWRNERLVRMGWDASNYERPGLQWTQRNFVCVQMMIEQRDFYDRQSGKYTVDKYLDTLQAEFGGIDSVLIWNTYPNLGVDSRNQFDRLRDMPGGLAAVKQMVSDFHRRGVRVLFPETPWDLGTRDEGMSDWAAQAHLMAEVDADGVLGDTMDGVPQAFLEASEKVSHPLALQPEGLPAEEALKWNEMTWGYWSYPFVPMISRYKWLETRHMPVLTSGGLHHLDGIQAAFFNGVGYADQEDVIGIHNGFTLREREALRRVVGIERTFANLLVSPEWEPHTPTLQYGVFASKFPGKENVLWTFINRNQYAMEGEQIELPVSPGTRYFDLWHGVELHPSVRANNKEAARLTFSLEPEGFGAILSTRSQTISEPLQRLLETMRVRSKKQLADYDDQWEVLRQRVVDIPATRTQNVAPEGMVLIPGSDFEFKVKGLEVAGKNQVGVDVQYPWEDSPRRFHDHIITIPPFYMDRTPVTNAEFKKFLDSSHYHPRDDHNFLRSWRNGVFVEGAANEPVTWVSLEDARAYASWAGKRLPHEWEWQYAAQGLDGRLYPWGNQWDGDAVPKPTTGRLEGHPASVDAHTKALSPFGVMDLMGNVWQWTDEFEDTQTRTAVLRGGSYYQPQGSTWYFPQAYRLDEHGKYLLMAPSMDRAGTIGFRCVADVAR
jgi:formylglycine-generating enzyme required for sulfatase activity